MKYENYVYIGFVFVVVKRGKNINYSCDIIKRYWYYFVGEETNGSRIEYYVKRSFSEYANDRVCR